MARITEDGFDVRWCNSVVLSLIPDDTSDPIDIMGRDIDVSVKPAEIDSGILTVGFGFEWWVTDSRFFQDWSDRLWNNDGWQDVRDEDDMYIDIADKLDEVVRGSARADDIDVLVLVAADRLGYDPDEERTACLAELIGCIENTIPERARPQPLNPKKDRIFARAVLDAIPAGMTQEETSNWLDERFPGYFPEY